MKIVHFSDPHAGGPAEDWLAYLDKRWVGAFNYRFRRRFRHDMSKLERAVELTIQLHPDVAVCTGDLTSAGQPGEFQKVLPFLQKLRDSDIPVLYTPGNHDCYVRRPSCVQAMREAVEYLSKGMYSFDDFPFVRRFGSCDFLVYNTSAPSNLLCSWGFVTPENTAFLEAECAKEKKRPRILVSHYPLLEEHPLLRLRHRLFGQTPILRLLENGQIDLSLCGHVHRRMLHVDARGRGECCAGSVTRNGTMTVIHYEEDADVFRFETLEL